MKHYHRTSVTVEAVSIAARTQVYLIANLLTYLLTFWYSFKMLLTI